MSVIAGAQAAGPWHVATNGADTGNDGLSWSEPFATISNAIATAGAGANETIWVSNGVYTLTASISNPAAKACRIRAWSTNPANTALLGPGSNDVTNFRGVWMAGAGVCCDAGVISNCIIAGNIMGKPYIPYTSQHGGGIYLTGAGVVNNCDVIGNQVVNKTSDNWAGGGGIFVMGDDSSILNCRVMDNTTLSGKGAGIRALTMWLCRIPLLSAIPPAMRN